MRLTAMVAGAVLAALAAGPAQAVQVKVMVQYEVPGFAKLGKDVQGGLENHSMTFLQKAVSKLLDVTDFAYDSTGDGVVVKFRGNWLEKAPLKDAGESIRNAALEAAAVVTTAKMTLANFRIEVEDSAGGRGQEEREMRIAERERSRRVPRLDVEVKDKLFEELAVVDVPLVWVMDRIGKAMPVSYVLHAEVVGRPVYVRLRGVTLEEALAAIAESAHVKLEKREKYIAFVEDRTTRAPEPERSAK